MAELQAELSGEQQKRIDLLNEYEALTAPDRHARNAAMDGLDSHWKERWLKLQGEIDQARATRAEQLGRDGIPAEAHAAILAKESATLIEQHEFARDIEARKLEEGLVMPKRWLDFLKEKAQETPEDPTLTSLIDEAQKSSDTGIEGLSGTPAKTITLADLVHSVDQDGAINYKRGLSTVIRDVGTRLDVRKHDDRDIEAALKIAAQKFDLEKGLMLTGDAAFKVRTAEIAGRLGLPLQNAEPEVLMAWKRGAAINQNLYRASLPSVERGITGDLAVPKPLMELDGAVLMKADPLTIANAEYLGVTPNGEGVVSMQADRVLKANAIIRETPLEDLRVLARSDLSKPDGSLDENDKARLKEYGLLDDNGHLTQTSGETVREKQMTHVELKQEAELKKDQHDHEKADPFGEIEQSGDQPAQEIKSPARDAWDRGSQSHSLIQEIGIGR